MKAYLKLVPQGLFYLAAAGNPALTKWGLAAIFDLVAMYERKPGALRMLSENAQKINDLFTERFNAWLCLNKSSHLGVYRVILLTTSFMELLSRIPSVIKCCC